MEENFSKIIDGKRIADEIIDEIKAELNLYKVTPGLALILVGTNSSSEIYVNMKSRKCSELGYFSVVDRLPESTSEIELLEYIKKYNKDPKIHGILVQLPLPEHINEISVLEAVDYKKDIDGFHPINSGRLVIGEKCFVPCTPAGIQELLRRNAIETSGKNVVVIGRSNIVGKPIANLLYQKNSSANSTVTICHSATKNISEFTRIADIIIAALGKPKFIKADMIKQGCVIIDVGINRIEDKTAKRGYRIVGDVDFDDCLPIVKMITPVPGGVGPMTISMLMKNTLDAALKRIYP